MLPGLLLILGGLGARLFFLLGRQFLPAHDGSPSDLETQNLLGATLPLAGARRENRRNRLPSRRIVGPLDTAGGWDDTRTNSGFKRRLEAALFAQIERHEMRGV